MWIALTTSSLSGLRVRGAARFTGERIGGCGVGFAVARFFGNDDEEGPEKGPLETKRSIWGGTMSDAAAHPRKVESLTISWKGG